jgi:hypothetical protein
MLAVAHLAAFARFVGSIRRECLSRVIPLGERHLRLLVSEFVQHYHLERNHQGLDNRLVTLAPPAPANDGDRAVCRRQRLGGLLNSTIVMQLDFGSIDFSDTTGPPYWQSVGMPADDSFGIPSQRSKNMSMI